MRELLAGALDVPEASVDDDTPFLTLGLDSLGAVDLVKRLERTLGRDLPTTLFFEHRTVRELAAHLDGGAPEGPDGEPFPLTPVQLALYTSGRLHPDVPARGHLRLTVRGPLDTGLLGRALSSLAERHGMLRLRVAETGGEPVQRVAAPVPVTDWYVVLDCAAEDVADVESAVCNRPFDLTAEPPVRAVLLRHEPGLAQLLLVVHHAAADGYSLSVLAEELWAAYTALWHGEPAAGAPAPDFARYTASTRRSGVPDAVRRHWAECLAGRGEPPRLPYDGDPDAPASGPIVQHHGALDAESAAGLERLAAAHGVSLFHLLLAAYARCLARWTGRPDVAVNVARAGRDDRFDGVERLVGPLADTLPLLCEVTGDEPVVALAERLRRLWLESERHAGVSSLDLARMLPGTGAGPRTVSPAGFSFARFPAASAAGCPVEVRATAAGTGSAATRLTLLCWADGPVLRMSWNYPAPLFDSATVARLDEEFRAELAALAPPPAGPAPSPRTGGAGSLVDRLLETFRTRSGATAVDAGEASLTYGALDRASAALAARLRAHGVRRGDLVGLLTEPGPDTVVGVVGVLRAGAGWVPLDPEHPRARLDGQLARAG
ncbi:LOW QUALITY PROTEIN: condensation domain-containing protein, partial [Streptomyces griseoflavus Tu4000]